MYYGVILRDVKRLDEAASQLQQAISLDPQYAAPHQWLGTVYQAQGNAKDAIAQYRQFLDLAARDDANRHAALGASNNLTGIAPDSSH